MSEYIRQFNIYCDESSVENLLPFFVIGALLIPRSQKKKIVADLKNIKSKYRFQKEIKWNKVTSKYLPLYKELIDYFADNNDIEFKSILIKKDLINMDYHDNDKELMFYKFYYQLLKRRFKKDSSNYIFTDYKSRRIKLRLKTMQSFLSNFSEIRNSNINIKHLQEYESKELELLQLCDLLAGAVAYANNFKLEDTTAKSTLVNYIKYKFSTPLDKGTNLYFEKFNIFKWIPNNR